MAKSIKKLEKEQRKRVLEKLAETEPGTKEYRELQAQLGAYSIMSEKDRSGKVSIKDIVGWSLAGLSTIGVIAADQLVPNVLSKIKLGDAAKKIFK